MPSVERDENREHRIETEIIVDAENQEDRAMGWYNYLDDTLNVPFMAKLTKKSGKTSAVEEKKVEVMGMAPDDECLKDMYVEVVYPHGQDEDLFSVKLSDLVAINTDSDTKEAIADWHYWLARGYKF
ncbi:MULTISPECIES: calcium-binding protein [unclassified Nodularia (in: cyanobacteria)]|uniref:calcium-binding protein n=1 Tax=unclassified Nodularia (in: cyanobacteria) TaxID=2656917 RepID=UPI001880836B|nr:MULTISPECIES: calcium-binding protein [unclassified Nodularia (in: cyanobacteria)]MBE9200148.1 calcium-binding protein [Nodularia sp. LEGE 06071]MCC2694542.1 calcium-binding protein [Nodularia sp. LEGE 04288]